MIAFLRAAAIVAALSSTALPAAAQLQQIPFEAPVEVGDRSGTEDFVAATETVENGGVGVRVLFLGRNPDGKHLTVSAQISNNTEEPIFIAVVGPAPAAVDNFGVTYALDTVAGLATCSSLAVDRIEWCLTNAGNHLPSASFSLLQPKASSVVAMTFVAPQVTQTGFLSLALNLAVGSGERPSNDRSRKLENVSIAFPLIRLGE